MPTYRVLARREVELEYTVEAEDPEEAGELVERRDPTVVCESSYHGPTVVVETPTEVT